MFIKFLLITAYLKLCFGVEFQILNREGGDIWVGIQGNPGHAHLSEGGFVLQPGKRVSVHAAANWAGRFWARTWCNPGTNHCDTGDCGNKLKCNGAGGVPPASLAEITLKGWGGLDYYDVSLVDGFNIMVAIEPLGGQGDGGRYSCKKVACQVRLNDVCPEKLRVRNGNGVIACNSACNAFHTDQYCCRGAFGTPDTCKSSSWPENYPKFFKDRCPDAYSYAYDDHKSTFTCKAPAYLITFGG
ncbi:uncharacterized protein LOC663483 [Tribolium castaneum]|uniref:Pathogenesis-related protein 5-like Protein n=1 Tax=Tribolium castaneum TaxID=7070 RepID=D6W9V7_TRICA|nr:PREDICTED: pathogenesis-related protein 5 [Tribolium castaneum]EEZ98104.1 Pathogenesis-related protein 5-like Protein [Tribolium castaneum]|eukprot:XP_968724.1 PREDICTED: pathogenesis-related protein 5 [Tribolium castaneum]